MFTMSTLFLIGLKSTWAQRLEIECGVSGKYNEQMHKAFNLTTTGAHNAELADCEALVGDTKIWYDS